MVFTAFAIMTSKGQLTIPKAMREALGLHEGSRVRFEVDETQGVATVAPVKFQPQDLWAMAVPGAQRMSFEEMDAAKQRRP